MRGELGPDTELFWGIMLLLLESTTTHGRRSRRRRAGELDTSVPNGDRDLPQTTYDQVTLHKRITLIT